MAEIEITLPTVQYGNAKIRTTPEELDDVIRNADAIGVGTALLLNIFAQGFKAGSQMDVSRPETASTEAAPGDPQAAAERLADGRPPHTVDEANAMARAVIEQELGSTTEVESGCATEDGERIHGGKPAAGDPDWNSPEDAAYDAPNDGPEPAPWESTVDAKPKPWETGGTAPTNAVKVAEINW